MKLFEAISTYLTNDQVFQLAQASALPVEEASRLAPRAVTALVNQLAQPADLDELNARWDMCRQLYLSQLLTDSQELLRTDIGWPNRRRLLAEKLLGAAQFTSLTRASATPAAALTLLGYLTVLTLAVLGEQADQAGLSPGDLGQWLAAQRVPEPAPAGPTKASQPVVAPAASRPAAPAPSLGYLKLVSIAGGVLLAGVGGYFLVGSPTHASAETSTQATATAAPSQPVAAVAAGPTPAVATAPLPAAAATPAASVAATPSAKAAKPTGEMLRDTLGNAAMALFIGGRFNAAAGRYPKGNDQPLIIKLANRVTLTVGINSTESLLYKRLVNPALPRPTDVVLDRLTFDNSQARLGAEGAQQLGSVANLLKTFPKARLLVLGHANPGEGDATKLGLKRATVALEELQKQGISPDRVQAQGVLATGLPTDNDSPERQAMLQGISLKISRL